METGLPLFKSNFNCEPPTDACKMPYYIPKKVDCDNDGILDFVCTAQDNSNQWLILSSEGCPNQWGKNNQWNCFKAFQGMIL